MKCQNIPGIVLIGGGGHCKACIDVIEQESKYKIAGIVDTPKKLRRKVLGYEIIANDNDLEHMKEQYKFFLITLGQLKSPEKRINLFNELQQLKVEMPIIKSPLAYVSKHAHVGEGVIIMHHAVVNAGAHIGKNCIVNTKALIEHDAVVEDHCHISTGAIVNGGVIVGTGAFLGSNSVIKQSIQIGRNSIVGIGVTVRENVQPGDLMRSDNG